MKRIKLLGTILMMALLLSLVLEGWKLNSETQNSKKQNYHFKTGAAFQEPGGSAEYFYQPAGDLRIWHVIDRYSIEGENDTLDCNNSELLITKDSVTVINDYVGISLGDDTPFETMAYYPGSR